MGNASKFIIKAFCPKNQKWIYKEETSHQNVMQRISSLEALQFGKLFVYELKDKRIKHKWEIGLIENEGQIEEDIYELEQSIS